jgi:Tol biopolymer transport system component
MRHLIALVSAVALVACEAVAPTLPSSSPLSGYYATPTASPSPTPAPTPVPTAGIDVVTAAAIPRAFHYFSSGQGDGFRILLWDEEGGKPPVEVLRSGRLLAGAGPDVRSDAFSASADGRVLVVMRRLAERQLTYSVVRPETGEIRALLSGSDLGPPVVSPDGARVAFARVSDDPAVNGLWLFAIAPGAPPPARLVSDAPQRVGSPPQPIAWSDDGKWLAISPVLGPGGTEVGVVDPAAGETRFDAIANAFTGGRARVLGLGDTVDWRAGERALLITSSRDAFGGRTEVYTADVTTGAVRSLYLPGGDAVVAGATWHPSLDRYAVIEGRFGAGAGASQAVWVRRLDGQAAKVAELRFLSPPWWSRDGTKLFSVLGGDDSTGSISNHLGTGGGTIFCTRGGDKPPCP